MKKGNNFFDRNPLLLFIGLAIITIALFRALSPENGILHRGERLVKVEYSQIKRWIEDGSVQFVGIGHNEIRAKLKKGVVAVAEKVEDPSLVPLLDKNSIPYSAYNDINYVARFFGDIILPLFIFFGIWFLLSYMFQRRAGSIFGGTGKLIKSEKPNVKFTDVAGNDEAKEEVKEIVDFLRRPDRYRALGAKIPKGVLLVGPPGTGKTLLAKAVAGEADVPFFAMDGSSFVEMFVGVGASRVRELFKQARKEAPSIIFIDEIDAIGKSRLSEGFGGGNDEREQTLNQLLAEMDGFDSDQPVIVLAATNRPEILDPALLRPGRFDRHVLVDKPDLKGRLEILKIHSKEVKLAKNVSLEEIARMTAGLVGADLANIVNEAALLAGRKGKEKVEQEDLVEAVERQITGLEKKSRRLGDKEKEIVAYHELGHAIVAEAIPEAPKVKKISIVPRGLAALGYTLHMPEEDKFLYQKRELLGEIDVLLGGRAAEELFIGDISTGAGNDLERANSIIRSMVGLYGMSEVAGLMVLEKQQGLFLGGRRMGGEHSEALQEEIDQFIKKMLAERYQRVKKILEEYRPVIEQMKEELFFDEVIEGERLRIVLRAFKEGRLEEEIAKFHFRKRKKEEELEKGNSLKQKEEREGETEEGVKEKMGKAEERENKEKEKRENGIKGEGEETNIPKGKDNGGEKRV